MITSAEKDFSAAVAFQVHPFGNALLLLLGESREKWCIS